MHVKTIETPKANRRLSFIEEHLVGLINNGTTCYLNSLLQSLYHTPKFCEMVFKWRYDPEQYPDKEHCIPYQLQRLFAFLTLSKRKSLDTTMLTNSFGWKSSELNVQHDVHEVNRKLLEELIAGSCCNITDSSSENQKKFADDESFSDLFCGTIIDHIESVLERKQSGEAYQTTKVDSFMDLQLAISDDVSSVEEAIESFLKPEEMKGDNKWCCEELGNKKIDAIKKLKLASLPYILTLQLKRVNYQTNAPIKLGTKVTFPFVLDMSKYADDHQIFDLFSVIVHSGDAVAGHYFVLIRSLLTGKWIKFNDTNIEKIDKSQIESMYGNGEPIGESTNAYMLMYSRRDPKLNINIVDINLIPKDLRQEVELDNAKFESETQCNTRLQHDTISIEKPNKKEEKKQKGLSISGTIQSSTLSSEFGSAIGNEFFTFLFAMQANKIRKGTVDFIKQLILQIVLLWCFVWIPLLNPVSFRFGEWASWIIKVLNFPITLLAWIFPYYANVGLAVFFMITILAVVCCFILANIAVKRMSRKRRILKKLVHVLCYSCLLISAPVTYVLTSFVDCSYGLSQPKPLSEIIPYSRTSNGMVLNRFPNSPCFDSVNIPLLILSLLSIVVFIAVLVLSLLILPNSHPLSNSPMLNDNIIFHITIPLCNVVDIVIHSLIPPYTVYLRSIVHIVSTLLLIILVFQTIPMIRRFENTFISGIIFCRLATSISGLVTYFVNETNDNIIGIIMFSATLGLMIILALIGCTIMECYTRYITYKFKSKFFRVEPDTGAYKASNNLNLRDNRIAYLFGIFLKFEMMKGPKRSKYHAAIIAFIKESLHNFSRSMNFPLVSASIMAFQTNDGCSIAFLILTKRMTPRNTDFISSYSLCQKKKEIEAFLCEDDSNSELISILSKIRRKTEELYALHKDFWKEFLKESINMEVVERIIFRSSKLVGECDCIFKNLLPFYNDDKTVLRIYAQYLVSFKANPELSNDNFNKANLLEESECTKGTKKIESESSISEITTDGETEKQTLEELEMDPQTRKTIYSNALATPLHRTSFMVLFVGFSILSLVALVIPFILSLIYSDRATSNVLHSREACATIPLTSNLLLSRRGYQIINHWMQSNISIEQDGMNDFYFDSDKYKQHVRYFTQSLVNLENVALSSGFSSQVYSQFTDIHYLLVIPTLVPGGILYNLTESNKYPLSEINKILKLLASRFLLETNETLLQTYTNFLFMFFYRNQNTLTQAYSLFCHSYTQFHIDEALNSRGILIIYTAAMLPFLLIVCVLYLIYSRLVLSRIKNHVKLLQEGVSKPEVGEIYHALYEQQTQEVITHAGAVEPLKQKICFPILVAVIFLTVGVCTGIMLYGLIDNTNFSIESFVNVQDVYETAKYLQHVAFYNTELYAYYRNVDAVPLITKDEALNITLQYYQDTANLQRNWDWCLFGSTTKPFETVVAGMFLGTDHMIKGDPNCTIPETDTHFNSTCSIGIDTMLTHILTSTQILVKQNLLAPTILFQPVTIKEHITSFLKILYVFNLSSRRLIDFANIFAIDASVPNVNYMVASFVIGLILVTFSICSMYYIFCDYANAEQQMRIMFNYLSIETLASNEKLKNYTLFYTLPSDKQSKLFTHNVKLERDAKLMSILNTFVDGVITCNDAMLVDIFNPAAQRMFGYQPEDVIGKPIKIFTREDQNLVNNEVESIKKLVTKACPRGETFELECVRKNQKTFPATVNIYVTFFEKKHITLFFIKDSTSEKRANLLLKEEKKKSENLLLNILPSSVAHQLLAGASLIAEKHPDVTCFFSDMVEFTTLTSQLTHTELVQLLNSVVNGFDDLTDKYNVEKVKTIGDSYFCCAGLNNIVDSNHPERILKFSIDCFNVIRNYNISSRKPIEKQINIRIGIHTGSVTAGVIGKKKFAYDLWGDTINTVIFIHQVTPSSASSSIDEGEENNFPDSGEYSLFNSFTNFVLKGNEHLKRMSDEIEIKKQELSAQYTKLSNSETLKSVKELSINLMEKSEELLATGKQEIASQYSKLSNSETLQSVKTMSSDLLDKTVDFVKKKLDVIPPSEQESLNSEEIINQNESNEELSKDEPTQENSFSTAITLHPKYSERMNFKRSTFCEINNSKQSRVIKAATAAAATTAISAATLAYLPTIVGWAGFTKGGIVAGSIGAKLMSAAAVANGGGVVTGSLVSALQVIGATGAVVAAPVLVVGGIGVATITAGMVYYQMGESSDQCNCNCQPSNM